MFGWCDFDLLDTSLYDRSCVYLKRLTYLCSYPLIGLDMLGEAKKKYTTPSLNDQRNSYELQKNQGFTYSLLHFQIEE